MSDQLSHVIEKIKRLMALATSSNVHEAAAAAAQAARLMAKYQVDQAQLGTEEEFQLQPVDKEIYQDKTLASWEGVLAGGVAKAVGVRVWRTRVVVGRRYSQRLVVAGTKDGIVAFRYLFGYLSSEVLRLAKADKTVHVNQKAYIHAFKVGAAGELQRRLKETHKQVMQEASASGNGTALIRLDQQMARIDQITPTNMGKAKQVNINNLMGLMKGKEAGKTIKLGDHGQLGQGLRQLKA